MRRIKFVLFLTALLGLTGISAAEDCSNCVGGGCASGNLETGAGFVSNYLWRGSDALRNTAAIQPYVNYKFGASGFSALAWFSFATDKRDIEWVKKSDEMDVAVYYNRACGKFATTLGFYHVSYYSQKGYIDNKTTSYESVVGIALPEAPLSPGLTWYHDFNKDNGDGEYITFAISKAIPVPLPNPLVVTANVGYTNQAWFKNDDGDRSRGVSDASIGIANDVTCCGMTITPSVSWNYTPNKNLRTEKSVILGSLLLKKAW